MDLRQTVSGPGGRRFRSSSPDQHILNNLKTYSDRELLSQVVCAFKYYAASLNIALLRSPVSHACLVFIACVMTSRFSRLFSTFWPEM